MLKFASHERVEKTFVSAIGLSDLAGAETKALAQAWKKWRGWHSMPSSRTWTQSNLGRWAAHASIARVIDGGGDYAFEFIGSAHVHAYGVNHQGRRVSDIMNLSPRFGRQLKASYDLVRISGHPHAFQGAIGAEDSQARFVRFETAYLPLGDDGTVDVVLNAAFYQMRDGIF